MQRPANLQTAMSLARAYERRSAEAARAIQPSTTRSVPRAPPPPTGPCYFTHGAPEARRPTPFPCPSPVAGGDRGEVGERLVLLHPPPRPDQWSRAHRLGGLGLNAHVHPRRRPSAQPRHQAPAGPDGCRGERGAATQPGHLRSHDNLHPRRGFRRRLLCFGPGWLRRDSGRAMAQDLGAYHLGFQGAIHGVPVLGPRYPVAQHRRHGCQHGRPHRNARSHGRPAPRIQRSLPGAARPASTTTP